MSFSTASRRYLIAAQVHLATAGALIALSPWTNAVTSGWDGVLWLLVPGFVGFATAGFGLHLFPTVSRRTLAATPADSLAWWFAEAGIVIGLVGKSGVLSPPLPPWTFALGASSYLVSVALILVVLSRTSLRARSLIAGPSSRPGDAPAAPLFITSWSCALGASALFVASGFDEGPGFGWWVAGLHLFLLGHAVLLVSGVSLRMVPRSLNADPPRAAKVALLGLGGAGGVSVPAGMLAAQPSSPWILSVAAAPEAAFAVLFLGLLIFLGVRARRPRPQLGLHLASVGCFVLGGGLGLWMVGSSNYDLVPVHAVLNVLGFVGLTILFMWFGMIAPFQRSSHAWTQRMLWILSLGWISSVVVVGATRWGVGPVAPGWTAIVGGIIAVVAVLWGAGSVSVLYPEFGGRSNPPIPE